MYDQSMTDESKGFRTTFNVTVDEAELLVLRDSLRIARAEITKTLRAQTSKHDVDQRIVNERTRRLAVLSGLIHRVG